MNNEIYDSYIFSNIVFFIVIFCVFQIEYPFTDLLQSLLYVLIIFESSTTKDHCLYEIFFSLFIDSE